jgi:hypothetical protein
MEPRIHTIGLCGFAGAGKDSVADILVAHAGFRKIAFADALKAELCNAFHVEPLVFIRPDLKTLSMPELALERCTEVGYVDAAIRVAASNPGTWEGMREVMTRPRTPRETMQLWGTEYRRAHDDRYWTRQVVEHITYARRHLSQRGFVITDCRFQNEVETLRAIGGRLWQVKRPGVDAGGTHRSTTEGSEFHPEAVINNSHDMKHLQQLVLGEYWALDSGLDGVEVRLA